MESDGSPLQIQAVTVTNYTLPGLGLPETPALGLGLGGPGSISHSGSSEEQGEFSTTHP